MLNRHVISNDGPTYRRAASLTALMLSRQIRLTGNTGVTGMFRFKHSLFAITVISTQLLYGALSIAQTPPATTDVVKTMIARELDASAHKRLFDYLSVEKSERTGGKLWTEHVVETPMGRVRYLMAEDGKPLAPERDAPER